MVFYMYLCVMFSIWVGGVFSKVRCCFLCFFLVCWFSFGQIGFYYGFVDVFLGGGLILFRFSCVHVCMCGVCVVLLCCSVCWSFAHYMLCTALRYMCSCCLSVGVVVVVMFVVGVVCCGCLMCVLLCACCACCGVSCCLFGVCCMSVCFVFNGVLCFGFACVCFV